MLFSGNPAVKKVQISPQLTLAVFQYLATQVDPFKSDHLEEMVLKKLLSLDVYREIKYKCRGKVSAFSFSTLSTVSFEVSQLGWNGQNWLQSISFWKDCKKIKGIWVLIGKIRRVVWVYFPKWDCKVKTIFDAFDDVCCMKPESSFKLPF